MPLFVAYLAGLATKGLTNLSGSVISLGVAMPYSLHISLNFFLSDIDS
ncbi:MAG: hypothetical protein IJP89_11640 [Synergistaceae bacterium]|nr:hypothetical protein [Synergistaceae bacterium]MBR0257029.1 hypothetical protein [Synergistaceae bacterium]